MINSHQCLLNALVYSCSKSAGFKDTEHLQRHFCILLEHWRLWLKCYTDSSDIYGYYSGMNSVLIIYRCILKINIIYIWMLNKYSYSNLKLFVTHTNYIIWFGLVYITQNYIIMIICYNVHFIGLSKTLVSFSKSQTAKIGAIVLIYSKITIYIGCFPSAYLS